MLLKLSFYPTLNPMNLLFLSVTRDGVISVNRDSGQFTDEYLPEQRSHLYGITAVYPYCPTGKQNVQGAPLDQQGREGYNW